MTLFLVSVSALAQDVLPSGSSLAKGRSLTCRDGGYRMDVRDDGRLAVYRLAPAGPALFWESPGEGFAGPGALEMREDNDLVLLDADRGTRWHSSTAGVESRTRAYLILENDGALCVYGGSRRLWTSGVGAPSAAPAAVTVRIRLPVGEIRKAILDAEAEKDACVIQ